MAFAYPLRVLSPRLPTFDSRRVVQSRSERASRFSNLPSHSHLQVTIEMSRPTYLSSSVAAEIDKKLMGDEIGYSLDQLMELAGHAVATAVVDVASKFPGASKSVCVVSGPGNCGGDGLVCARHLVLMGFSVSVVAVRTEKFPNLKKQLEAFGVAFYNAIPEDTSFVVDALFGFSFRPPLRAGKYAELIQQVNSMTDLKLISVDIPSGWDVDLGNQYPENAVRTPDALVSLTAPKLCARDLPSSCLHYVGGRFVPPGLASELNIELPVYETRNNQTASPIVLLP